MDILPLAITSLTRSSNTMLSNNEIITIVLAVLASLPGLLALRSQFNKDKLAEREAISKEEASRLEYSRQLMEDAKSLIAPLKEQIKDLQDEVDKHQERLCLQEKRIRFLNAGVNKLIEQIRGLGHEPVWTPPDE